MKRRVLAPLLWVAAVQAGAAVPPSSTTLEQAADNYRQHCQSCHGANRFGAAGPALLPESLSRIKPDEIRSVIESGRPASQMAGYANVLSAAQINAMVDYLQQPPTTAPTWSNADILASHSLLADVSKLPNTPQHGADPLNLFVVVEAGDHHIEGPR